MLGFYLLSIPDSKSFHPSPTLEFTFLSLGVIVGIIGGIWIGAKLDRAVSNPSRLRKSVAGCFTGPFIGFSLGCYLALFLGVLLQIVDLPANELGLFGAVISWGLTGAFVGPLMFATIGAALDFIQEKDISVLGGVTAAWLFLIVLVGLLSLVAAMRWLLERQ